jgi:septum formation protein
LILASASPRRSELLRAAGFTFDVIVANVDERTRDGEDAASYVRRLAAEKSAAVRAENGAVILAADTAVVVDGDILGKPRDDAEAAEMLRRLSGRWHEVMTGISLRTATHELGMVETTRVQVASLSNADMSWYVSSGEGRDKAGAYAIQGLASRSRPWSRCCNESGVRMLKCRETLGFRRFAILHRVGRPAILTPHFRKSL